MTPWTNWAGTASAHPRRIHRPSDTDELRAVVADVAERGGRVRPVGSGHSFTPVAAPDPGCDALDLGALSGLVRADVDTGLVTVRAGTTLRRLNALLDALGLAMTNLGDIDAQTVAGAISTGTHGTGAAFGGLATQVAALELVTADGSLVRCSPDERPELFDAARVSLGALGVLTTVTLRCEPAFVLQTQEGPLPLDRILASFDDLADTEDHVEFYWFPYGRNALVKRNTRCAPGTVARPLSAVRRFVDYTLMENAAFGALCRLGRAVPRLVPSLGALASSALSTRRYSDTAHRVFATQRAVRFVESEYAVPRERLPEVLDGLRALVPRLRHPVAFPAEIRVAAGDDVWLSTAYGRDSAYIAVHQYVGMPYEEYFAGFAEIADAVGGRPHWGKLHALGADRLRELYPRFDDFRRVRAELDPHGVFGNAYLDRVLGPID
ncbi:D-arabinono-1,4-lactone oxidase [Saccharomonospora azurea]|uniref:FAD-linked oxidoreductase n=1 Tax=Saccharomonospora azurea NA-128 TaxID=882081 RepID=H8GBR2_9PSEU|nr:D-arabinono-1,4-lactone oxidase [Saccharomonospora azurea]EHK88970.1 FAD-linked oxidoreductase [Saccharomonospora azurea SZMC 14600]EHY89715.1 FAD-linked oxidoreductase [Saccharomonospora azurea NA-128]